VKSLQHNKDARFFLNAGSLVVFILLFFSRCGVNKVIPEGEYLLVKNSVVVKGNSSAGRNASAQILHRTNKRVIFNRIPLFLWLYAVGTQHKTPELSDSIPWRRKLRKDFGEEPVLFNPKLAQVSSENIRFFIFNQGYFDAESHVQTKIKRNRVKVKYEIDTKSPYLIRDIYVFSSDSITKNIIEGSVKELNTFKIGKPCNLNELDDAEETLTQRLRDSGFFTVNASNIHYEIDTNQTEKTAGIRIFLDPPEKQTQHKKFVIGKITVSLSTAKHYLLNAYPNILNHQGLFIELNHYPLNGRVFRQAIKIDSGSYFSQSKWTETYRRLLDLNLFKSVDISQTIQYETGVISPKILLQTEPRMNFSAEPQILYSPQGSSGTNFQTASQRSFGLAGILSFNNRNTFGNGEYFKLSSITSFEAIFKRDDIGDFFTGLQQGVIASLKLPKLSRLNRYAWLSPFEQQSTLISTSFQYEQNPNFIRSAIPANITLQFAKKNFSWFITPLEISYNRNIISPNFLPNLPALDQDFVRRVFTDQIVTPLRLGMIYSQNRNKPGSASHFLRFGIETSGNWHRLYRSLSETQFVSDSAYQLFGVNYFQYTKLETEYRFKQNIDELNSIAFRVNMGIAIPFGNSDLVPYDKRYFIGGSNSLRGWRPRGLGPGNTPKGTASLIDRSGEVLLEFNLEYRFTLIRKLLESAIFFDAGNIWTLTEASASNPNYGVIQNANILNEMALNTGVGLRFDLGIFLFRLDWGLPLRDPSLDIQNRWILTERLKENGLGSYLLKETSLAIGIGYPF